MTGNNIKELFGQQEPPKSPAYLNINICNYKLTSLAQLIDRLLPPSLKKDLAFEKLKELKSAIDSAAIHTKI